MFELLAEVLASDSAEAQAKALDILEAEWDTAGSSSGVLIPALESCALKTPHKSLLDASLLHLENFSCGAPSARSKASAALLKLLSLGVGNAGQRKRVFAQLKRNGDARVLRRLQDLKAESTSEAKQIALAQKSAPVSADALSKLVECGGEAHHLGKRLAARKPLELAEMLLSPSGKLVLFGLALPGLDAERTFDAPSKMRVRFTRLGPNSSVLRLSEKRAQRWLKPLTASTTSAAICDHSVHRAIVSKDRSDPDFFDRLLELANAADLWRNPRMVTLTELGVTADGALLPVSGFGQEELRVHRGLDSSGRSVEFMFDNLT